jgi:hypothetical protein
MKPNYDKWRKRLAGETVVAFTEPDENDVGFYGLPIRERAQNAQGHNNGRWKVIGYKPVALFVDDMGALRCQIANSVVASERRDDSWQSFVSYPITEEIWRSVTERGEPWPDFSPADAMLVPAANREVTAADNTEPDQPLDVQHAVAIDNAIAAALKAVTNEAEAAQALGSKNRIAELRLAADKAGKAIYEPIYRTYTAEQKKWSPIVARATAKEKELNTAILTFREKERQRIAVETAAKQREIDEANAKAAERDIALAELPTEVVEPVIVAPTPIVATYGTRKLKEEVKTFLDSVNDFDAVYTYFKGTDEIKAFLTTLATAAIKAGRTVPGTTTRTGLI